MCWCMNPLQANRLGPESWQYIQEFKVCTQESPVCPRMYPSESREIQYQISYTGTYQYIRVHTNYPEVCTGTYFLPQVCTGKHTFITKYVPVYTQYILVHTWEKKYILVSKSTYQYILGVKRMYRYILVYVGLYRYHTIAWYIPVHTGTYWYELGTYHWLGFQMFIAFRVKFVLLENMTKQPDFLENNR